MRPYNARTVYNATCDTFIFGQKTLMQLQYQLHAPLPPLREGVGIRQGARGESNSPTPWAAVDYNFPINSHACVV
jgi:hypothetical protein